MADPKESSSLRLNKLRNVIKAAFTMFDKSGSGQVFKEEIPCIMRYLGQFPSDQEVEDTILRECVTADAADNVVQYHTFENMMLRCLMEHEYDPDDDMTLYSAFRCLDPDNRGWIDTEVLRKYLGDGNSGFNEKELSEFMEYAKDKTAGSDSSRIHYEDYCAKLTAFTDAHIENLYRDVKVQNRV